MIPIVRSYDLIRVNWGRIQELERMGGRIRLEERENSKKRRENRGFKRGRIENWREKIQSHFT